MRVKRIFSGSPGPKSFRTKKVRQRVEGEHDVFHRHGLIQDYDQEALNQGRIVLVGGGGLGSWIGTAVVRKGLGEVGLFDGDCVEISNLSRQHFFERDLYKPKGTRLARNLRKHATNDSIITGFPCTFQEAVERGVVPECDVAVVGVDNSKARFFCSKYFYQTTPVIFTSINHEADAGYVFIQEPGKACFGCAFGDEYARSTKKCVGSTIDISMVMAGIVSYAIDSLLMKRMRSWNYKRVYLSGYLGDLSLMIQRESECAFCWSAGDGEG